MRKMALDIGDVRIGIATSDPMCIIASGYQTFVRTKNYKKDLQYIASIIKEKECDTIVIGLPINMDGTCGERVDIVKRFAEDLLQFVDVKVVFQDERLSTVAAEKSLIQGGLRREKRKNIIDKVAATLILQSYLDKIK